MTDPFLGLVPPGVTFGGPAPAPSNDNVSRTGSEGFSGLLLRRTEGAFEIILSHSDPARSQRVETADDDADIIALWRSIGRKVGLPLLAETADGQIVQIEPSPWMNAAPRRGGSPLRHRRPRFLACRKPGATAAVAAVPKTPSSRTMP